MKDPRGLPVSTASPEALGHAEQALWRMMSFYDAPLADLDAAAAADPMWVLPGLMKAGFLLSLAEPAQTAAARDLLQSLPRHRAAVAREEAHRQALLALADGRWSEACRLWDAVLIEHPTDALALQWAHLWDLHRGDLHELRARPARCLPAWPADDPLQPLVAGMLAFGLEENHEHAAAEDLGRRALARDPRGPWAIHAVAHTMEMQGRFDEGAGWLRQQQPHWATGNGYSVHLWWHAALFRLEGMDTGGALRLADGHLAPAQMQVGFHRLDAAALLWRLHLLGQDVAARARNLIEGWALGPAAAGHSAFHDLHVLATHLAAGQVTAAEAWVARCAERAMDARLASHGNHRAAREVGLPLMRALLGWSRGGPAAAEGCALALYAVRPQLQGLGGSHAQRDLIDQTLLAACAEARTDGTRRLGAALLRERSSRKGDTPLARAWRERVGA